VGTSHQWHRGEVEAQNETWLAHWERVKASIGGPGVTLALTGGRGTGKTQLATAAGWHICYSGRGAIYSRAAMLCALRIGRRRYYRVSNLRAILNAASKAKPISVRVRKP